MKVPERIINICFTQMCDVLKYSVFKDIFFRRIIVLAVFLFISAILEGQVLDSIKVSFTKKPTPRGGIYSRYTFIDGFQKPILGIKLGLSYNNTIRFYIGGSYLKYPYYTQLPISSGSSVIRFPSEVKFWYLFEFTEYVFHKNKKWEFSIPLQIGSGAVNVTYFNNQEVHHQKPRLLLLYEPAISFHYKVFYWVGIGADIGYRFMWVRDRKDIGIKFNSPVYTFRTIIFWGEILKKLEKNKRQLN